MPRLAPTESGAYLLGQIGRLSLGRGGSGVSVVGEALAVANEIAGLLDDLLKLRRRGEVCHGNDLVVGIEKGNTNHCQNQ